MKVLSSQTIVPDGPLPDLERQMPEQSKSKGFFASLRQKIAEGRGGDHHVAEPAGDAHLGHDSKAAAEGNEVRKRSLPRKRRSLVPSFMSSWKSGGPTRDSEASIVNMTNYANKPPQPYNSSGPITSPSSFESEELDIGSARQRPSPAPSDAASLHSASELPAYPPSQSAAAFPSFDARPEPSQPVRSLANVYPSLAASSGNPARARNDFDPYFESPYYSSVVSPVTSLSSLSSLLVRHANEPDCVTAIEWLEEVNAAFEFAVAHPAERRRLMPDIWRACIAANEVLTDCEGRRVEYAKWRAEEEWHKLVELKRRILAWAQENLGHNKNPAVVAWLQGLEKEMQQTNPTGGDDVAGDDPVGQDAA